MKKIFFAVAVVAFFSGVSNAKATDFEDGMVYMDYGFDGGYSVEPYSWTYSDDYEECEVMCKI